MIEYPALWQFFGGYLGPDWPDEYANEWAALDDYLKDHHDVASRFASEVQLLLAEHPSEDAVRHVIFDEFHSAYLAEVDGWRYREWLQALADHVLRATGHPQAS